MKNTKTIIPSTSFEFLKKLRKNNNREWFNANKQIYQRELSGIESFTESLLDRMKKHDRIDTPSGKKALMRIYRDIRFSADKTPYKTNFSGSFHREGKLLRGGYYFQFEPGNSFIAGGFWGPSSSDLKLIRDELVFDDKPIRKVLASSKVAKVFTGLTGETLTRVPRGYDAASPAADLLKYKQFLLQHHFTDTEILAPDYIDMAETTMKALRPFFDYMSEVLYVPS
ncbi:DUF2461 domain-containing protein [Terrimonas sp. NA20]|uniref:DUF2461 domain-containing protein n=1 Tax=Terrimonas ginsenosidimutans TaxID=2908004 RepID=A0ABS9KS32_9BACT|nr:DUF2461 domain-containing protein [Terrimonas ginsenosidimutans]MCG2615114.1 DUF2461 domain-containing protein [Terrimonas ginsenosidimutans]